MSLNIDMNECFLWKFLVFVPSRSVDHWLYRRAATLWILGRCSTRSALHRYRHNLCSFSRIWHSKLRWNLDVEGSFRGTTQNPRRRRLFALKIDNCFITNQWQLFPWILCPINFVQTIDLILVAHQFRGDIELLFQSEIFRIRTWSFTLFTNSAASLPMTKFSESAPSWELTFSGFTDPSWIVSPYLTECAFPSRRGSPRWGATCCFISQEVVSGFPDRSCAAAPLFHSWEDQDWP